MAGKSKRVSCDESCKYKEVYQIYEAAYNSAWDEFSCQTGIIMILLSFIIVTGFLYFRIISECDVWTGSILTIIAMTLVAFELKCVRLPLLIRMKSKRFLRKYKISLSNIAANKITEHVYRIQSIEDIKNENIFTDEGRLNKRESILHCIDDSGNTMDVYINPNKSYWFDENDNNILSTDGIVSELLFSDDGETSETGVIKYTVNDKTVYIKEVDIEEIYESED